MNMEAPKSAHAVGDAVEVAGYSGVWVVAAIDYFDAGIPMDKPIQVRTLERDDVEGYPTRFGTIPVSEVERYVWLQVNDADIARQRPDVVTPKVTMVRRGVDDQGPWKHAEVAGRRFPEVDFGDRPYAEFVVWLKTRGCVIPPNVAVYEDRAREANGSGNAPWSTTLSSVLEFERNGLLEPDAVPANRDRSALPTG